MKEDLITCPCCSGSGKVGFRSTYPRHALALDTVACYRDGASATDLWAWQSEFGVSAFNQRLEQLRRWGFLEREKVGREWKYRLTEQGRQFASRRERYAGTGEATVL